MARILKFRIWKEDELYYQSSENKGADQLRSYCEADLRLCFRILFVFSCHIISVTTEKRIKALSKPQIITNLGNLMADFVDHKKKRKLEDHWDHSWLT